MKTQHTYRSDFILNSKNIEPFYIVHKAQNIIEAKRNAKWYIVQYFSNKGKSTNFINNIYKNVKTPTKRLKKL